MSSKCNWAFMIPASVFALSLSVAFFMLGARFGPSCGGDIQVSQVPHMEMPQMQKASAHEHAGDTPQVGQQEEIARLRGELMQQARSFLARAPPSPEENLFRQMNPSELNDIARLRKNVAEGGGDYRYYECQDALEAGIRKNFSRTVRFLVVGGNNGILADRLAPAIIAYDWEGTYVEANPVLMESLKANLGKKHIDNGSQPLGSINFVNQAVATKANQEIVITTNMGSKYDWEKGAGRTSKNDLKSVHGVGNIATRDFTTFSFVVKGDRLANMLAPLYKSYDVVQIDVEQFDNEVLKQLLDDFD